MSFVDARKVAKFVHECVPEGRSFVPSFVNYILL